MQARQVACLCLPYFGAAVARQADPRLEGRPLALLDAGGRVLTADALAAAAGIAPGLGERQAADRCPGAALLPAARYPLWEAQDRLWARVKTCADRWQPAGLGCVYLDATPFSRPPRPGPDPEPGPGPQAAAGVPPDAELLRWCQSVATTVRQLGWEPALGVTASKFGADVAGQVAGANAALLIAPAVQRAFLAGRPLAALPIDVDMLTQLRHLGIRTLGQFARLPAAGVLARFGPAGRTAQRWALGLDDRPIVPPWETPAVSARIELDGPSADGARLLALLVRQAGRLLLPLQEQLQAAGRLELLVTRADGRVVPVKHIFPQPTAAGETIRLALAAALQRVAWDGQPAAEITLTLAGITDAPGQQLALFDLSLGGRARLEATLRQLSARFSPNAFRLAALTDPDNPLPERRVGWQNMTGET